MQIKIINFYSGENNQPIGEEKRLAAGLNALSGRASHNLFVFMEPPISVSDAPRGYSDKDILVPFVAASFGGDWSNRAVFMIGYAKWHQTNRGGINDGADYCCNEDGNSDYPIVIGVLGSDNEYHLYSGHSDIESVARGLVSHEILTFRRKKSPSLLVG